MLKPKDIAIACHDAGGAEILAAMVVAERRYWRFKALLKRDTPAWRIFERRGLTPSIIEIKQDEDCLTALHDSDLLICGTGTNDYEWAFLSAARLVGIQSISVLDHWVNYRERFGYPEFGWQDNLPDFLAVTDERSLGLARDLNLAPIIRMRNYYLLELLHKYRQSCDERQTPDELLFVSESVEEHYGSDTSASLHPGFTQSDVLYDVLESLPHFAGTINLRRVTLRLHPAEAQDKYDSVLKLGYGLPIVVERPNDVPLDISIARARVVIGISSMALLIAYLLGKPSVSVIPCGDRCNLPLPDGCCLTSASQIDPNNIAHYAPPASTIPNLFEDIDLSTALTQMEVPTA